MITILTGMKRQLIVVLICIPLTIRNVEHLFMCLLASSFPLGKTSVRLLCPFLRLNCLFVYVDFYELFTYVRQESFIDQIINKYLLPFDRLSFHFVNHFLSIEKLLSSIRLYLFILAFICYTLGDRSNKTLVQCMSECSVRVSL